MPRSHFRSYLRFLLVLTCLALLAVDSTTAWSQQRSAGRSSASAVMGRGIHSYFSGQSATADRQLTAVINAGSRDARAYYFRALARLQQGRQYEAEQDMLIGAALEARNPGSSRGISKTLMRVQGANRRTLEKFRREGRLTASQVMAQEGVARSQQLRTRESYVLRKPVQVPVEKLLDSSGVVIMTPDSQVVPGNYVEIAPGESAPATRPTPQPAAEAVPAQTGQSTPEVLAPSEAAATPQPELAADPPAAEIESFDLFETPGEPETAVEPQTEPTQPSEPETDLFADEPAESDQPSEAEMEAEASATTSEAADNLFDTEPTEADAPEESFFAEATESAETVEPPATESAAKAEEAGAMDDLFSTEPEESTAEESTELATSEEEMSTEEIPEEEAAADDLFELDDAGNEEPADEIASPVQPPAEEAPAAESGLPEESKVGSKKLLGILGRAAGGMVPKPDVSISEIVPPLGDGASAPPATANAFELGPEEGSPPAEGLPPTPAESPASGETPSTPVDDLFELEEEAPPMKDDSNEGVDLFEELDESPAEEAEEEFTDESEATDDPPRETEPTAESEETPPAEESSEDEVADEEVDEVASSDDENSPDSTEEDSAEEESVEDEAPEEDEETDDDPFDLFD